MAKALAAARLGFRRFFSISAFTPPPPAVPQPKADPSPNLFISGLSKRTTTEGLREAFSKFGDVVNAKVVTDRVSGYSKGFGFVRYASVEEAVEGIKGMDGKFLDGWVIFAEYARPREPPSQAQASFPQSNYSSSSPYNYPSQASQMPLSSPNYSPDATQPPSSNSYYAPQSNYSSPMSQTAPSFGSTQPQSGYYGQPQSGYYEPQNPQPGYFSHPPQASQGLSQALSNNEPQNPQPRYASQPSGTYFSHSSQPSTWYPSQTTSGPPQNTTSGYSSNAHSNNNPRFAGPASSYAPGYNSSTQTEASDPSSYASEVSSNNDPSRVVNY